MCQHQNLSILARVSLLYSSCLTSSEVHDFAQYNFPRWTRDHCFSLCIHQNCQHLSAARPNGLHDADTHLSSIRLLHVYDGIIGRTFHKVVITLYIVAFHICAEARASSKRPSGLCYHWLCSSKFWRHVCSEPETSPSLSPSQTAWPLFLPKQSCGSEDAARSCDAMHHRSKGYYLQIHHSSTHFLIAARLGPWSSQARTHGLSVGSSSAQSALPCRHLRNSQPTGAWSWKVCRPLKVHTIATATLHPPYGLEGTLEAHAQICPSETPPWQQLIAQCDMHWRMHSSQKHTQ